MKESQDEEERKRRDLEAKENEDNKDDEDDEDADEEEQPQPDAEVSVDSTYLIYTYMNLHVFQQDFTTKPCAWCSYFLWYLLTRKNGIPRFWM